MVRHASLYNHCKIDFFVWVRYLSSFDPSGCYLFHGRADRQKDICHWGYKISPNVSKEWSGICKDFIRKRAKIEKSILLIL